tara:strand:+ start:711 stop:896 length:186 start_codon:yes stop_codon:yes gene_type:complete
MSENDIENMKIRKFLKQVGVKSHQLISQKLENNNAQELEIKMKVEIDGQIMETFETKLTKE